MKKERRDFGIWNLDLNLTNGRRNGMGGFMGRRMEEEEEEEEEEDFKRRRN